MREYHKEYFQYLSRQHKLFVWIILWNIEGVLYFISHWFTILVKCALVPDEMPILMSKKHIDQENIWIYERSDCRQQ